MSVTRLASALVAAVAVVLYLAAGASATGPGGWDHLGTGVTSASASLNGRVDSLISVAHFGVTPDSIYAGGVFTSAGGDTSAAMIARWDGSSWHSIGAPPISTVTGASVAAIAVDRTTGKIYVGGNFINAGGNPNADFVAVWDGTSWQPACNPTPQGNVAALQIIGRTLYVGGAFSPPASLPTVALVVPTFSHTSVSHSSFRVGSGSTATTAKAPTGTSFRFTLKAPAKVTIAIAHSAACVKPQAHGKRCTRAVKNGTLTRSHLHNGSNAIAFSGRIGKKALKPGRYTATLTASNAKGKAKPVTVKTTVVK